MLAIRTLSHLVAVFIATMTAVPLHAQEINENTKEQLRQLKVVCDEGLVSPEVCKEKQRNILGLRESGGPPLENPKQLRSARPVDVEPRVKVAADIKNGTQHPHRIRVTLPSGWRPFTTEELTAGREALLKRIKGAPKAKGLLKHLTASTASAEQANFQNDGDFLQIGHLSPPLVLEPKHMEKMCQTLSEQAEAMAGDGQRPALLDCGLRRIGAFQTLYVEKNSIRGGVRVIELWVVKSPEETFHFFLRCKTDHMAARTKELEEIIASVQWR